MVVSFVGSKRVDDRTDTGDLVGDRPRRASIRLGGLNTYG
jgi:hypothetical protein